MNSGPEVVNRIDVQNDPINKIDPYGLYDVPFVGGPLPPIAVEGVIDEDGNSYITGVELQRQDYELLTPGQKLALEAAGITAKHLIDNGLPYLLKIPVLINTIDPKYFAPKPAEAAELTDPCD